MTRIFKPGFFGRVISQWSMVARQRPTRGFTVLLASLVASLLLAVGLAIFDIFQKEVTFATVVRDSNFAIYAADTGAECALYWDVRQNKFPTSSADPDPANVFCNGQDIMGATSQNLVANNGYTVMQKTANSALTTFAIFIGANPSRCAIVQVSKQIQPDGSVDTAIVSRGYNTCVRSNPNRVERAFKITY